MHHFKVEPTAPDAMPIGSTSAIRCSAPSRPTGTSRRAGRILAAFYIPSMPAALLALHGIDPDDVAPAKEAFALGDIERALALTPDDVADRIMVAGTPEDWIFP